MSRQSLKASGSWNHHYQEQQHRTKGAESQGRERKPETTNQNKPGRGQCEKITQVVGFELCLVMNFMGRPELKKLTNVC